MRIRNLNRSPRIRRLSFIPWQQTPGGSDLTGVYPDAEYGEDDPINHWWTSFYIPRDKRKREEGDGVKFPAEQPFMEHQKEPFYTGSSIDSRGQTNKKDVFPFPQDEYNEDWYDLTHGYPPTTVQDVQDVTDFNPHQVLEQDPILQEYEEEKVYEPESFRPWPLSLRKDLDLGPTDTIRDRDYAWASVRKGQYEMELEPEIDKIRNDDTGQIATVIDTGADWHLVRDDVTGEEFFLSNEDLQDPTTRIRQIF